MIFIGVHTVAISMCVVAECIYTSTTHTYTYTQRVLGQGYYLGDLQQNCYNKNPLTVSEPLKIGQPKYHMLPR